MKILTIVAFSLLSTNLAVASAPQVICELTYSQDDAQGNNIEYKISTVKAEALKTNKIEINGFELSVSLDPICPAGGRCSSNSKYQIQTSISKNDVITHSSQDMVKQYDRQYLNLVIGTERAYSLCDVQ